MPLPPLKSKTAATDRSINTSTTGPDASFLNQFSLVKDQARNRLMIGVDGRERGGKNHFAFTAPDPIVLMDFDTGSEGVVEKFSDKRIIKSEPFITKPDELFDGDEMAASKFAEEEWNRFYNSYVHVMTMPVGRWENKVADARTVIIDTGTDMYSLLRLKEFGKLTKISPFKYREVNTKMRDIFRHAERSNVNLIVLHRISAEWKKSEGDSDKSNKTGVWERNGWEDTAYTLQANLFAYRAPLAGTKDQTWKAKCGMGEAHQWTAEAREPGSLGFRLRFLDSRHKPELEGVELMDDMIDFATVAQLILPMSKPEDWK
jgi:AAA domain